MTQLSSRMAGRRAHLVALQDSETTPIWEPGPDVTRPAPASAPDVPPEVVSALIAGLTRPLAADEGHAIGNARRERDLLALIAGLEPVHAYQLGRRLDIARAEDPLVIAWRRLVIERRQRLRTALQLRRAR